MSGQNLNGIRKIGDSRYLVTFGDVPNSAKFEMWVDGEEIEVLHCEDSFYEHVHFNTGSLGPVLDAVMRFHRATSVPFPPPEIPGSIKPRRG